MKIPTIQLIKGKKMKRLDYNSTDSNAIKGLLELEKYVANSNLERCLYHLVKIRASQINACAYCIDMHTKEARKDGETEQRLYTLSGWRETSFFTKREEAALAWTEALTLIAEVQITDELYQLVAEQFEEKELLALSMTIIAINSWNRLAIPFQ